VAYLEGTASNGDALHIETAGKPMPSQLAGEVSGVTHVVREPQRTRCPHCLDFLYNAYSSPVCPIWDHMAAADELGHGLRVRSPLHGRT
jgi:hypothetical protein